MAPHGREMSESEKQTILHLHGMGLSGRKIAENLSISRSTIQKFLLYNYRLLMRSTHDHEDRVRYWLTDAEGGGQPIPDKVFMVMSRPKSKVYYSII